jgi:hypothetical protein
MCSAHNAFKIFNPGREVLFDCLSLWQCTSCLTSSFDRMEFGMFASLLLLVLMRNRALNAIKVLEYSVDRFGCTNKTIHPWHLCE